MEAEKMELKIIKPGESGFLQHIEWNADEIRQQVETMMSAYTDVVYTEDTMKSAKDDRATLNKFKKAIEDRRKEVKRKCMEPYEKFESEIKEIVSLIDKPILMIDSQIKEYEEQQKLEKKGKIQEAYNESIGDLSATLPFDRVFDTRYLNATFTLSKAIAEVKEKIDKVKTDLATIDSLDSKHKLNVRDVYMQTLDLSKAMAEDRRLKELEERLEAERKAKEEAEQKRIEAESAKRAEIERRKAEEAQEKSEAEAKPKEEAEKKTPPYERGCITGKNPNGTCPCCGLNGTVECCMQCKESCNGRCGWYDEPKEKTKAESEQTTAETQHEAPQTEAKRYKATFWCKGTLEQIQALGDYMRENNIEFGKVAK